jgi:hypothetical protein
MAPRKPSRRKRKAPRKVKRRSVPAALETAPSQGNLNKTRREWEHFRTYRLPVIILILVTIAAYANAWPNNLVGDDPTFAVSNRYSDLDLAAIGRFFNNDVWGVTGWDSGLYRPLLLVSIMFDSILFGDWVAGYHLSNIFLHVLTTVLVYGLVRHLLIANGGRSPLSDHIAVLSALIFGVHPIHTEVLNSIFNRSEILVSLGMVGGLWWFLRTREVRPGKAWLGLSVIYLVVLFCKESGATLPALAVILLWATLSDPWRSRLKKCLPVFLLAIPLGIYAVMRAHALESPRVTQVAVTPAAQQTGELPGPAEDQAVVAETEEPLTEEKPSSAGEPPGSSNPLIRQFSKLPGVIADLKNYDPRRPMHAVRLWADSLELFLWPHPLRLYHGFPKSDFWPALSLQVLLLGILAWGSWKTRTALVTGLLFFYISIMPSSGILGFLALPHVAERFLYLPSVGLTISLAFGLGILAQKFSIRWVTVSVALLALVLTPLNWARNADWATDIKLNEAEYRNGARSSRILGNLVLHNLKEKNVSESIRICDLHASKVETSRDFSYYCGMAFESVGRYDEAKRAYGFSASYPRKAQLAYLALALLQVKLNELPEAKKNFEQAIALMNKPFLKNFHTALMLIKLYPYDHSRLLQAQSLLERTLEQQPEYFPARLMLQQLNQILASGGRFDRQ